MYSDWLCREGNLTQPIRSTTQICVVTLHQYVISAVVLQTSFRGETSRGVAKCRLFRFCRLFTGCQGELMKPTRFHPRSLSLLRILLHDTTTRKCHTVVHKHDIPRLLYRRENFILVRYPVTVSSKRRTTTGFDMKKPLGGLEREAHVYNFRHSKIASHCFFQRVTEMGSHILRILVRGDLEIGRFAFSKVIENE